MNLDELKAALAPRLGAHAAFDGWGEAALAMAAARARRPGRSRAASLFPAARAEMIDAWFDWIDKAMLEAFPPEKIAAMKIRDRIRTLLLFRLQTLTPLSRGAAPCPRHPRAAAQCAEGRGARLAERRPDLAAGRRHRDRFQPLFEARDPDRRLRLDDDDLPRRRERGSGRDAGLSSIGGSTT